MGHLKFFVPWSNQNQNQIKTILTSTAIIPLMMKFLKIRNRISFLIFQVPKFGQKKYSTISNFAGSRHLLHDDWRLNEYFDKENFTQKNHLYDFESAIISNQSMISISFSNSFHCRQLDIYFIIVMFRFKFSTRIQNDCGQFHYFSQLLYLCKYCNGRCSKFVPDKL